MIMIPKIRNSETERLVADLARLAGETRTEAVTSALQERLARLRSERARRPLAEELDRIAMHCASLPVLDSRAAWEILGYDDKALPRGNPRGENGKPTAR